MTFERGTVTDWMLGVGRKKKEESGLSSLRNLVNCGTRKNKSEGTNHVTLAWDMLRLKWP